MYDDETTARAFCIRHQQADLAWSSRPPRFVWLVLLSRQLVSFRLLWSVCVSLSVFLSLPLSPAPSPLLPLLVPFFTSSLFSFSLLLLLSPPSLPVEPPIMPFIAHSADCTLHDAWLVRHTSTATKSTSTSTSTRARESITSA
ncbi:hypothetical protein M440DRAFT_232793 [Trichoderma longibrachiatum ATCC 18648]|uniref:Transmembrane protein n=1 Tax=Trichoderma longibrachiatum ATCC 18648 TaxID=983965 RepID=A0A2T4CCK3_TRILO|nr:hypothetical protein M440DRAFT_232793 [Trichoderma longibrachiatum ATCC 18648]